MRAGRVVKGLVAVAAGIVLSAGDFVFGIDPPVVAQPPSAELPDTPRAIGHEIAEVGGTADRPGCVRSPTCGNGHQPLERAAAARLPDVVLAPSPV